MKIGLTYDLRTDYLAAGHDELETAEFDREDTIDALEAAIRALGHTTDRIGNARRLIERLVRGNRWDLVFNIAEGLNGIGREAQVPAILDLYNIPYTFSDPLVMSLTLHKGMTKRVIRDAQVPTSDFCVVEKKGDEKRATFQAPYFIKPVAEGTGKGVSPLSILHDHRDLASACEEMKRAYHQPVLVERYLSGREFTVGIIGTGADAEVLGTIEVILLAGAEAGVYSYVNKERCEELVQYRPVRSSEEPLVQKTEDIAMDAWRILGCRDAGRVDIRCDEAGQPYFLEVNPLAGLHPDHSDLPIICKGISLSYEGLIKRILASAFMRIDGHKA
ncbi:MAG: ATP-grasp domain-containing protein [Desulfobacterales bacterium]